jgi:hypothetical protein
MAAVLKIHQIGYIKKEDGGAVFFCPLREALAGSTNNNERVTK